jgi:hypothetical protein
LRVGVQCTAHEQAAPGDRLDAQQIAVGQGLAGLPGHDRVVVLRADDQVPGAGGDPVADPHPGATVHDAEVDQVVADPPG